MSERPASPRRPRAAGATFTRTDAGGWLVPGPLRRPRGRARGRARAGRRDRPLRAREDRGDREGPRVLPPRARLERRQGADSGTGQRVRAPRRARQGHGAPRGPLPGGPPRARDGRSAGGAAPERDRPLPLLRAGRAGGRDAPPGGSSPSRARTRARSWSRHSARRSPISPAGSTSSCPGRGRSSASSGRRRRGRKATTSGCPPEGLGPLWERLAGSGRPAGRARGLERAAGGGGRRPVRGRRGRLDAPPGGPADRMPTPSTRAATSVRRSSRGSRTAAT